MEQPNSKRSTKDTDPSPGNDSFKSKLSRSTEYESALAKLTLQVGGLFSIINRARVSLSPVEDTTLWSEQVEFRSWYMSTREWLSQRTTKYDPNPCYIIDDYFFDPQFINGFLLELCANCSQRKVDIQIHCGHSFCKECLSSHAKERLELDEVRTIKCFTCFEDLNETDLAQFLNRSMCRLFRKTLPEMNVCSVCGIYHQFDGWRIEGFCKHICLNCLIIELRRNNHVCSLDSSPFPRPLIETVLKMQQACAHCGNQVSIVKDFDAFPCSRHKLCRSCIRACAAKRKCLPCMRLLDPAELSTLSNKRLKCGVCSTVKKFDMRLKCQCVCERCAETQPCREC